MSATPENNHVNAAEAGAQTIDDHDGKNSSSATSSKLSKTKPPPRKKSMAAKAKTPNQKKETNVPWKTNYEIVNKACKVLDCLTTMTTESGNNERLAWSQLVGNEAHLCPYLPTGKKVSLFRIVTFVAKVDKYEADKMVKRVGQFIKNSKHVYGGRETPDWKRDLINKLKVDIQK